MLKKSPNTNSDIWGNMHPLNGSYFDIYFQKAYSVSEDSIDEVPMWDDSKYGKIVYNEWEDNQNQLYGMRYHGGNSSGMKHGVVRTEYKNGSIEESTWFGAK